MDGSRPAQCAALAAQRACCQPLTALSTRSHPCAVLCGGLCWWLSCRYAVVYRLLHGVLAIVVSRSHANVFANLNLVAAISRLLVAELKSVEITPERVIKKYAQVCANHVAQLSQLLACALPLCGICVCVCVSYVSRNYAQVCKTGHHEQRWLSKGRSGACTCNMQLHVCNSVAPAAACRHTISVCHACVMWEWLCRLLVVFVGLGFASKEHCPPGALASELPQKHQQRAW